MKKIVLLSALLIAGLGINAQTVAKPQTAERTGDVTVKATNQTNRMAKELTLTDDQKTKVYAINLAKDKAINETPANKSKLNAERKTEINGILTPEQQAKFKTMMESKPVKAERKK